MATENDRPEVWGFLLVPGFALMSYASAIEPLRAANVLAGRTLYRWAHLSCDEAAEVRSSAGLAVAVDASLRDEAALADLGLNTLLVCAGGDPASFRDERTFRALRRLARVGVRIGGISGGPFLLARAGLLDGYRATVHWEHLPALAESHPQLAITGSLYEIDRERLTCAGGIAALDMMRAEIDARHGPHLAQRVGEWFVQEHRRPSGLPQRTRTHHGEPAASPPVAAALALMSANLERPLGLDEIARRVGLGRRQLERRFRAEFGTGFGACYRDLRLERARALLKQTRMRIVEIALACGFGGATQLARACRLALGRSPSELRAGLEPVSTRRERADRRPPA